MDFFFLSCEDFIKEDDSVHFRNPLKICFCLSYVSMNMVIQSCNVVMRNLNIQNGFMAQVSSDKVTDPSRLCILDWKLFLLWSGCNVCDLYIAKCVFLKFQIFFQQFVLSYLFSIHWWFVLQCSHIRWLVISSQSHSLTGE